MKYLSTEQFILVLLIFSLFAKFVLIPFNQGMWWDEAVYLSLGRSITQGFYSLEQNITLETFRPPLFPLIISPLHGSVLAARFFVAIMSIIAVFCIYLLGKEIFNKRTGLIAALFTSAGFYFVFFTTKVLSEPLLIIMISMSMYFFHKWTKEGKTIQIYLAGIFAALAFLTRYFGAILFFSYIAYFILSKKKDKRILEFLSGYFIVLSPWFFMNQLYYGNPLGALYANLGYYLKEVIIPLSRTFNEVLLVMGLTLITMPIGFILAAKNYRKHLQILSFLVLSLAFFAILHHKEPRYLLSFYPVYSIIAACGLNQFSKFNKTKFVVPVILSLLMIPMMWGLQASWIDRASASGLINATHELKSLTMPGEVVLAQSYPYVYYFAERSARKFPYIEEEVANTVRNNSIRYVLYHKFEDGNPEYAAEYFKRFEIVKRFEEWKDTEAVIIYRINETLL